MYLASILSPYGTVHVFAITSNVAPTCNGMQHHTFPNYSNHVSLKKKQANAFADNESITDKSTISNISTGSINKTKIPVSITDHNNRNKSFQCVICSKMFTRKYNLNLHYHIHSHEKPFKCLICTKTFTQKHRYR